MANVEKENEALWAQVKLLESSKVATEQKMNELGHDLEESEG
jgi:hypothetical protein